MINFTVGPVQMFERTLKIGAEQVPYFRTPEFSRTVLFCESSLLELFDASYGSRIAFITGSGTAAMEASITNMLTHEDHILIINGGSFGQRFVDIAEYYGLSYDEIVVTPGEELSPFELERAADKHESGEVTYTALAVNLNETSTGTLYDLEALSRWCERTEALFIVDAVSAFLSDPISMTESNIDVMFTGSQKALALAPGMSFMALSPRALERLEELDPTQTLAPLYLNIPDMLHNGLRGQTPYTPGVGIMLQLEDRLKMITETGGVSAEINRVKGLAEYFRERVYELGFTPFSSSMGHAVTSLVDPHKEAKMLFERLKDEYQIWICPNGGPLAHETFRVGHLGNLTYDDYDRLLEALKEIRTGK